MLVDNTLNSTEKFKVITTEVVYLMEEHQRNIPFSNKNSVLLQSTVREEVYQESQRDTTTSTGSQMWQERLTWPGTCKFGIFVLNSLVGGGLWLLDNIIDFCTNEYVQNVVLVFVSVSLELFLVLILAIATVFTSIIINIDDCYKIYTAEQRSGSINMEHSVVVSTDLRKAEKLCEEVLKEQRSKLAMEVPKLKALLPKSASEQEQEVNCTSMASTEHYISEVSPD